MINGITIRELKKYIDERGFFSEILREDWRETLIDDKIVQLNLSYSYPGIVKAWHRHLKGQIDYFICISGAIKVCAYDDRKDSDTFGELDEIILSEENLMLVKVPGLLWHGYKVIGNKPANVLYGVTKLYNYEDPDEERRSWRDNKIIPKSINGNINDPRVGKPWDWYLSPNK